MGRCSFLLALVIAGLAGCGDDAPHATSAAATSGSSGSTGAGGTGAGGSGGATSSMSTSTSSSSSATGGAGGGTDYCTTCSEPRVAGTVASAAVTETSGVAASAVHGGAFYLHNDSGDGPRFFAVDAAGSALGTFDVGDASAIDWEDMARGPCPAGSCLFLGDVGDNPQDRTEYTLYRVTEPAALGASIELPAEALPFVYPDGSHNCEAVLVHPLTGAVTVVTKTIGPSRVYELPLPLTPAVTATMAFAGELVPPAGSPLVTGGDVHPEGRGVLLRTYSHLWFYPAEPGDSVATALSGVPCAVPVADEPQGEAVAWLSDASGYLTISEGDAPPLQRSLCGPGQ